MRRRRASRAASPRSSSATTSDAFTGDRVTRPRPSPSSVSPKSSRRSQRRDPTRSASSSAIVRLTWARSTTARVGSPTTCSAAGLGCHHRTRGTCRARERPGPPRDLPPQRQRVPGDDARGIQGTRRIAERQLPLRRRGTAATSSPTRSARRSSSTPSSRRRSPRCCRRCRRSRMILQVADESGNELLPGAVWYEDALGRVVARQAGRRVERPTTSTCCTPAARPACPRACMWRNGDAMRRVLRWLADRHRRSSSSWPRRTPACERCSLRRSCTEQGTGSAFAPGSAAARSSSSRCPTASTRTTSGR